MTLTSHDKKCLKSFVFAISSTDVKSSEIDRLLRIGIISSVINFNKEDMDEREEVAGYALTDVGIECVKKYIPNFY